jgi:hypothetical protein
MSETVHFIRMNVSALEEHQRTVHGPHMKILFETKVRECLRLVIHHPWAAPRIGLIPCEEDRFLVNATIFTAFQGIKANSCNRNFRQHGFTRDKEYQITQETCERSPDIALSPRTWSARTVPGGALNEQSDDDGNHVQRSLFETSEFESSEFEFRSDEFDGV